MKLRLFSGAIGLSVLTLISSCGDDEKEMGTISQEDGKVKLQENGLALTDELEALKDVKSVDALISFSSLLETDAFNSGRTTGSSVPSFVTKFLEFSNSELTFNEFANSLRTVEDPQTLSELWNESKGTYTWNFETQVWDEELGGDKFIVNFPSTESGTTNDAVFTIQKYVGVAIKNQSTRDDLGYDGDLPGEFLADLVVGGTKELEYSFKTSYDAEDIPSDVETFFYVNPFKLSIDYAHSSSKLSVAYTLTASEKTILALSNEITGNLDYETISNADDIDALNLGTEKYSLQVMNVKLNITINNLNTVINDVEAVFEGEGPDFDYEAAADKLDEVYNSNSTILVYFTDTNQKIADAQFKNIVEEDWGYTEINPTIELIFEDGSKVAIDDYFESGFESLETEFNNLIDDLEAKYGN